LALMVINLQVVLAAYASGTSDLRQCYTRRTRTTQNSAPKTRTPFSEATMGYKASIDQTFCVRIDPNSPNLLQRLEAVTTKKHYRRGEKICSGTSVIDLWYLVVGGAAKRFVMLPSGRQQIIDLLLPGDMFDCSVGDDVTIEAAAAGTELACYPRLGVDRIAGFDPRLARLQSEIASEMVCRLEAQLLILGRTTALKKLAAFLLELARRQASEMSEGVTLPVSRYDIADYLAVSVETVSRSLTGLKELGLISFNTTRDIRIIDRDRLEDSSDAGADTIDMHRVSPRAAIAGASR
jgi:CRP/FNR family transcriptional regulator, nitrogen fixation regulation protein